MTDLRSGHEIRKMSLEHLVLLKKKNNNKCSKEKQTKKKKNPTTRDIMSKGHRKSTESSQWPQL